MAKSSQNSKGNEACGDPLCDVCKWDLRFELPQHLVKELEARRLVIFAGGGVSTEAKGIFPRSFYDDIKIELGIRRDVEIDFPDLMSQYADKYGRVALLTEIRDRLVYWHRFPEVYRGATAFHHEISTIPFLDEIFTTNWDDSFESICHAIPYVTSDDIALWNVAGRKVYKVHGSINNLGSIVATRDDYENCHSRLKTGIIGSHLKLALATKTLVFIGYSLRDDDFLRIWDLVRNEIGQIAPTAYWVTPHLASDTKVPAGLTTIQSSAVHFAKTIKNELVKREVMLPDQTWEAMQELRDRIMVEHLQLPSLIQLSRYPDVMFSLFYQDGLMHACDWAIAQAHSGKAAHPCYLTQHLTAYDNLLKEKRSQRNYGDVAYVNGFINGLLYPLLQPDERKCLPMYYAFGSNEDIRTRSRYQKVVKNASSLHKAAHRWAIKALGTLQGDLSSIVLHHPPFL